MTVDDLIVRDYGGANLPACLGDWCEEEDTEMRRHSDEAILWLWELIRNAQIVAVQNMPKEF